MESAEGKSSEAAAEPPDSASVFISYASQDAEIAKTACQSLESRGARCWMAPRDVKPGAPYADAIVRAITEAKVLVLVMSANAAVSDHVAREVERAASKHKQIIAFRIDAAPLSAALEYFLSQSQWIDVPALGMKAALAKLAEATGSVSSSAILTTPLPIAHKRTTRRVVIAASILVVFGAALVLGIRFWHGSRDGSQSAVNVVADKSIAVLPFVDMSEKKDQEYFGDGMAEEIIDLLVKIPGLKVIDRTSSFSFKGKANNVREIARILGVTQVLEGSVRKAGDHMRITAQLVRADNGFQMWSQAYDRDVRDIFAVQDDIAHAVGEQLKITLLGSDAVAPRQTISTEAYNLYLEARYLTHRDTPADLDQAVIFYQQALALAPNYAPAWAWLAFCHVRRVAQGQDTTGGGFTKATAAASRAIEIDPEFPEPYIMLALAHMQYDRNWKAAADALAKVVTLDPNNALGQQGLGHLNVATGRISDAVTHFQRAVDSDPLNPLHRKYLGRALHYAGHAAESASVLRNAIELNAQFPGLHYELGRALLQLGDPQAALAAFEAEPDPSWRIQGLPLGYLVTHRNQEARAALKALIAQSAGGEFQVAEAYAFFGETDKSFEWLERAGTLHDPGVIWSRHDLLLASIVADPRYVAFLQKMGMPTVVKDE